jgi:hypothetical protein
MSMGAWVWMYDMNGALEEVVRYAAYSEKDSQLLEESQRGTIQWQVRRWRWWLMR